MEQTYTAHEHGGLRHEHFMREGDGHDHRVPATQYDFEVAHHRPTTIPLHSDPSYLREFCAWAEGQYPIGTPGHAAVQAVLKGLRSAVYQARRDGRCLLCGGMR